MGEKTHILMMWTRLNIKFECFWIYSIDLIYQTQTEKGDFEVIYESNKHSFVILPVKSANLWFDSFISWVFVFCFDFFQESVHLATKSYMREPLEFLHTLNHSITFLVYLSTNIFFNIIFNLGLLYLFPHYYSQEWQA